MLEAGQLVCPQEEHKNCLLNTTQSALKTYTSNITMTELFWNVYAYSYMYVLMLMNKEGMYLKDSKEGILEDFVG